MEEKQVFKADPNVTQVFRKSGSSPFEFSLEIKSNSTMPLYFGLLPFFPARVLPPACSLSLLRSNRLLERLDVLT